ncbi:TIGR03084 family protein [Rhodococcus sp. SRB_17]|nr:TIGR03084 family protein [Rhodococcus sp. SRB_17]
MTDRMGEVLVDLAAEGAQLESWIAAIHEDQWANATPAHGWTIAHQIAHLLQTDEVSAMALRSRDRFETVLAQARRNPLGFINAEADRLAILPPADLLSRWKSSRTLVARYLQEAPAGEKVPWFGPPMSPTSMATARLMETWAHAHDISESLGIEHPRTHRAKHVAHLGVHTRKFSYANHGQQAPVEEPYVELTGPDGELWIWGTPSSSQRVTGDGYDFALLATRRRHINDVDVSAHGADATYWLTIIQAFAGAPGQTPRQRNGKTVTD